MTLPDRGIALEKHFRSYQELKLEQAWYSAAVCLAEIFHASATLPAKERAAWESRLKGELNEKLLHEVRIGLEQNINRIRRILSVGSEWTGEEILLVMQMRINIQLLSDFVGSAAAVEELVYLKQIDAQLSTVAKSGNHTDHFRWAQTRIKKTAVFDIERLWIF
ncbi:MAG TPA: hypothetical protein VFR78_07660 [Pyrinomonadaceae bacterium]|nr:hypothetical protein [Pyrinomonadaceae bacterium]